MPAREPAQWRERRQRHGARGQAGSASVHGRRGSGWTGWSLVACSGPWLPSFRFKTELHELVLLLAVWWEARRKQKVVNARA
jgi:hypothetical protein